MVNVIAILIIIVLFILAVFVLPTLLVMRSAPKVIRIFRDYGAVGVKNARTVDELGLRPKPFMQRILRGRDYKMNAFQMLVRAGIIQITDEGKVYLSEEALAGSRWREH